MDRLVKRLGTKRVMMIGFAFTAIVLIFIAGFSMQSPFWQLGTEFFFFGFFLDYTLAPAVDAIRGALPEAKAGVGSGMLSASRMVAGALGMAALGSALSGVYSSSFVKAAASIPGLPADVVKKASDSVGMAVGIAGSGKLPPEMARALAQAAKQSFMDGWHTVATICVVICIVGAIIIFKFMPAHHEPAPEDQH